MVAIAAALSLSACATRPGNEVLRTVAERSQHAQIVEVHAVTTREREASRRNEFTAERSGEPNYARFAISIPPSHEPGWIEWPREGIDPETTFAVVEQAVMNQRAFFDSLSPSGSGSGSSDVALFVHGFNTTFPEALFRTAQLNADSGVEGSTVVFAWPSMATGTGYVADRDSAAFSRDALVDTLTGLARQPRIGKITVLGHSMGAWLTMEALRQLRLQGRDDVLESLYVVLAAPDIDLDLFERQLSVIGPLDPPLTVLVSPDDGALFVSNRLGGSRERVGALDVNDPRVARIADRRRISIIDISRVVASDTLNHSRFVTLASMAQDLGTREDVASGSGLRRTGAFVFNSVGAVIASPFTLVGEALAGE